jgi:phage terminase large subunit
MSSPKKKKKAKRKVPDWAVPLLSPARFKGICGGRGGAKSHTVAELQLMLQAKHPNRNLVCLREIQKSLKDSSKRLLEDKIKDMGLQTYFDIKSTEIRSRKGAGIILFMGMADATAVTIKSLEGMDCAWFEEAQTLTKKSMDILHPTIRKEGSEIWYTWNPTNDKDPVQSMFYGKKGPPDDSILIKVNYDRNPFASKALLAQAALDKKNDPNKYAYIWGGETEKHVEARIFKRVRQEDFETPANAILRFGADWGFSADPTVLLRMFIDGDRLFIDHEAYEIGCEIDDTPSLFGSVPMADKHYRIVAGSDRPERISHIRSRGFNAVGAVRGPNSVMEGVAYLQNFTEIVVHTRCPHTWEEFTNYKHPIDPITNLVIPRLPTAKNHVIEAARYGVEDVRRALGGRPIAQEDNVIIPIRHFWNGARG